jgi:glycosyltransferase involved in cell wall biosynthesis
LDYATFYVSSAIAMLGVVRRGDTLIAETDPPLISIVAAAVAKVRGAHFINWLQDIFPEVASLLGANPLPRVLDALLRRCRDWSLRAARVNVVLGERMCERLRLGGIHVEKIRVIQNWAELSGDRPKPSAGSRLRARLGLTDEFVVGYSGNLGRAHEFQTLLGAAEILRADEKFVFLMIGGGARTTQLARQVSDRGLKNFRFIPHQPRESLADCLAAADVHWVSLLPALEGFIVPSKYYGILAAARPVIFIGDPDGELARDISAAGGGATVAVGESEALARLLTGWRSDKAHLEGMAQRGYQRYRERYCARRAFDQWSLMLKPP